MENSGKNSLKNVLDGIFSDAEAVLGQEQLLFNPDEIGTIIQVANSVIKICGLPNVMSGELISFPDGQFGMAFNLEPSEISAVLIDTNASVQAGMKVRRTGRLIDVPVGRQLLGRVIDPLGKPLDNGPPIETGKRFLIERNAPAILDRDPVSVPLQTGILSIDALIPIGRGQRELILGDRQTGKTAVAIDAIINQHDKNIVCVYCAIGQQNSSVAKSIAALKSHNAMDYTFVVVASGNDTPAMNFIAPYAATSMAEYFMESGQDVLIIYDDLSRHARSYREISLLLRRPPAREAYPGDIFYIHSRLLERATQLTADKGGGSLTALPIVETEAQNIAAFFPTNLVSITDGQIYLTPKLFQEGVLPPVDVGRSVSRVGGSAQLPAYRDVAGDLRLSYAQFEELEIFERFSTRLDEETRKTLERGHKIREVLKQPQYEPADVAGQIAVLLAITNGLYDGINPEKIAFLKKKLQMEMPRSLADIDSKITSGAKLDTNDRKRILDLAAKSVMVGKEEGRVR